MHQIMYKKWLQVAHILSLDSLFVPNRFQCVISEHKYMVDFTYGMILVRQMESDPDQGQDCVQQRMSRTRQFGNMRLKYLDVWTKRPTDRSDLWDAYICVVAFVS